MYRFRVPQYQGPLHDAMVLGEGNAAFATRGDLVVKFDVRDGAELWESRAGPEAEVRYATADGGITVRVAGNSAKQVSGDSKK